MKLQDAGACSIRPLATALTRILCLPGFSEGAVKGERHALNGLRSTLHWKLEPATEELNLIVGVRSRVFAAGLVVILVSGGIGDGVGRGVGGGVGPGVGGGGGGGGGVDSVVKVPSSPEVVPPALLATSWKW